LSWLGYGARKYGLQATVLRQWLYKGAENVVIKLIEEERITIGRATELLDTAYQDVYRIAQTRGIELGATVEQYNEGKKNLQSLEHLKLIDGE